MAIAPRPGAIPELDGLRGLAILLVLIRHATVPVYERHGSVLALGAWDLAIPLLNGWMGVDLFFVLSGFLITKHLLDRWPGRFEAPFIFKYWAKRVLRTFPAYYVTLFVVAFGGLPFYRPDIDDFGRSLLEHVLFLQDYAGSQILPSFWSLGVEEKFYLLCPFVLLWLGRYPHRQRLGVLICLAVLPSILRAVTLWSRHDLVTSYPELFWAVRAPFHLALDGLWMGVLSALMYRRLAAAPLEAQRFPRALLPVGLVLFVSLWSSVTWLDGVHARAAVLVLALVPLTFACILLSVTMTATPLDGFLRSRALRFFAVISYSVYLTHMTVVPLASALTQRWIGADAAPFYEWLIVTPLVLVLSVGAGLLLHLSVEKPFLVLKQRLG